MKRLTKLALVGVVGFLMTGILHAQQQGQQGQGQQGQGQVQQGQGQQGQGQQGQGQAGKGQAGQGQQGQGQQGQGQATGQQSGFTPGGISQNPWFSDPSIRQSLKLSDEQFNRLNRAYGEQYQRYSTGLKGLGQNANDQQRSQLSSQFNQGFNQATNDVFTDQNQRNRWNQMYLQYQGYGAFDDPMVRQKLNLTDQQLQQLRQYGQEWNQQMGTLSNDFRTNPQQAGQRFNQMRQQMGTRINEVLNPEQERAWREMTGEPFNFSAGAYFHGTTGSGTGGTQNQQNQNQNQNQNRDR